VRAWLTPDNQPGYPVAGLVWTPAGEEWESLPIGAYSELRAAYNFEQFGSVTPEDAAQAYQEPGYITAHRWRQVWNAYTQKVKAYYGEGLIAYWPLWEALGATRARDFAGTSHGTPAGATWETAGIGDGMTSITLSGTASRINVYSASLAAALSLNEGSVSVWANCVDWSPASGVWFFSAIRTGFSNVLTVGQNGGNKNIRFNFNVAGFSRLIDYAPPVELSGWHHLALTWSRTLNRVDGYLDGAFLSTKTHPAAQVNPVDQINIGCLDNSLNNKMAGAVAHVALWNRALTAEDIAHLAVATN